MATSFRRSSAPSGALLDYLGSSPIPALVLSWDDPLGTTPLLTNFACRQLLRGKSLSECVTREGDGALRAWLHSYTHGMDMRKSRSSFGSSRAGRSLDGSDATLEPETTSTEEIELELRTSVNQQERSMTVKWTRATTSTATHLYIVLTGLMVIPASRLASTSLSWSVSSGNSDSSSIVSNTSSLASNTFSETEDHARKLGVVSVARQARPLEERLRELELLTDFSACGLARLDLEGRVMWVNDGWYNINGHDRNASLDEWPNVIDPRDLEGLTEAFAECLKMRTPLTIKFRVKSGKTVLAHCTPNSTDPAAVTGWISNLTDVTEQVQAQELLAHLALDRAVEQEMAQYQLEVIRVANARREDAEEERRQQELLIDVTSHELRQPISAIIQNSELTRASVVKIRQALVDLDLCARASSDGRVAIPVELGQEALAALDEDIESLDSISACAMAQKLIADDILGLAQIQLNKYAVSPVPFDLSATLRTTMRIFASECRTKGIDLNLILGESLAALGLPMRLEADPTRLGQIFINLLSNAIRFTGASPGQRKVQLCLDLADTPPLPGTSLVLPPPSVEVAEAGAPMYLYFKVEDTGPGMTEEETSRLFEKFMQASPFTHCTMGGSGLGLFICRNLCELQGGRLEVVSQLGVGSTFRGYVTCHFADAMETIAPAESPRSFQRHQPVPSPTHGVFLSPLVPTTNSALLSPRPMRPQGSPTGYFDRDGSPLPLHISTPVPTPLPVKVPTVPALNPNKRQLRILAVDDNEVNRKIVRRQLEQAGHVVETANDGQQALDLLLSRGTSSWDVVIMDVQMPVLDGISATRKFRQSEVGTGKHLRIVGLTSGARDAQVQAALAAGMTCLVTKPYRLSSLLASLTE